MSDMADLISWQFGEQAAAIAEERERHRKGQCIKDMCMFCDEDGEGALFEDDEIADGVLEEEEDILS